MPLPRPGNMLQQIRDAELVGKELIPGAKSKTTHKKKVKPPVSKKCCNCENASFHKEEYVVCKPNCVRHEITDACVKPDSWFKPKEHEHIQSLYESWVRDHGCKNKMCDDCHCKYKEKKPSKHVPAEWRCILLDMAEAAGVKPINL